MRLVTLVGARIRVCLLAALVLSVAVGCAAAAPAPTPQPPPVKTVLVPQTVQVTAVPAASATSAPQPAATGTPGPTETQGLGSTPTNVLAPSSLAPTGAPPLAPLAPPAIPKTGVYLGAYVNPAKGTGGETSWVSQLPQFQTDLGGRMPGLLNFYPDFLTPLRLTDLQVIESKGSIPLISWGGATGSCANSSIPAGQYSSAIASGQYDQQITQYAEGLKTFGHPVFVRWFWEMNIAKKNEACNGSAGGSGYIAAWRHIYTLFHQAGATNVAFVWCPGDPGNVASMSAFFPGAEYVDWIGIDGYLKDGNKASSFTELFMPWYAAYVKYGKPLIVVETGAPPSDQASYLIGIGQSVPAQFPALKGIAYFDALGNNGDWELTPAGLAAFAQLLANPYFSFHQ